MKINEIDDLRRQEQKESKKMAQKSLRTLEEYAVLIKRDCQQFLQESKGNKLFRGINSDRLAGLKTIRKKRTSLDSSDELFNHLNYLMKKYGFITRSESALFAGKGFYIEYYGTKYLCFPLDGYKYLWSPEIDDYYSIAMPTNSKYAIKDENGSIDYQYPYQDFDSKKEVWRWWLHYRKTYTNTNLAAAIKSGNEILIAGKGYYAINWSDDIKYDYHLSDKKLKAWYSSLFK